LYRIFVRDLVLDAEVGAFENERGRQQRLRLNLELECIDTIASADDRLENVFCYDTLVEGIEAILAEGHVNLIETVADRIARHSLEDRRVLTARITVEKLDVIDKAASVGVTVERRRQ
jgi:dihydroneopterin aldolase